MKHMYQVGSKWYLRKQIPERLRKHFNGHVEVRRTLGTSDKREANRRLHYELAKIDAEFARLDRENSEETQKAAQLAERILRSYEEYEFPADPKRLTVEQIAEARKQIQNNIAYYREHGVELTKIAPDGEPDPILPGHLVDAVQGYIIQLMAEDDRLLAAEEAKLSGNPLDQTTLSLSAIKDRWNLERKPTSRTLLEFKTAIRRFEEINGPLEIPEIRAEHGTRFKDALVADGLKMGTVRKQLTCIKTLLNYAVDNSLIASNPLTNLRVRKSKDTNGRLDFSADDFSKLFAGVQHGSERYWIMRVAQYTGMRLSEICQLKADDVKQIDSIWCIQVTQGDGQSLKTPSSERTIPIHQALLDDGFLEFVPKEGNVFPSVKPDSRGLAGGTFSKWFTRYRRKVGITNDRKVFHSFRHTFVTAARERIPEEYAVKLTGHADGKVNRTYGMYTVRTLKEMINRITFPSVNAESERTSSKAA